MSTLEWSWWAHKKERRSIVHRSFNEGGERRSFLLSILYSVCEI